MSQTILLEVCIDSLESARSAILNGANRLEICSSLGIAGGGTPTPGLVRLVRTEFPDTPLQVMIRPRLGNFIYDDDEIGTMKQDIIEFKKMGVDGVVFGTLTVDGRVNIDHASQLAEAAEPLAITFHRAFDVTRDVEEALEDVSKVRGISRILTSGGALKALAATHTLARLIQRAREISKLRDTKLSILPGSGLNAATLPAFLNDLQAAPHKLRPEEVHCSCGKWVDYMTDGDVDVGPERIQLQADVDAKRGVFGFGFGAFGPAETSVWKTIPEEVAAVKTVLKRRGETLLPS